MKTRASAPKKAASSPTKAVAHKAFGQRPAAVQAIAEHASPQTLVTPNLQRQQVQGNLLGQVQVSPRAIIQPKLTIGQPGDKYEREADSVAEAVMNAPSSAQESAPTATAPTQPLAASITPVASGQSAPVQAAGDGKATSSNDNLASEISMGNSSGSALPQEVRAFMEPRFGVDLSSVRIHTDSQAGQMNQQLSARAFTYGNHIYFGAGNSPGNNALTAHELAHVVQQTGISGMQGGMNSAKPAPASAPAPRVQRATDYGTGLGGPLAA